MKFYKWICSTNEINESYLKILETLELENHLYFKHLGPAVRECDIDITDSLNALGDSIAYLTVISTVQSKNLKHILPRFIGLLFYSYPIDLMSSLKFMPPWNPHFLGLISITEFWRKYLYKYALNPELAKDLPKFKNDIDLFLQKILTVDFKIYSPDDLAKHKSSFFYGITIQAGSILASLFSFLLYVKPQLLFIYPETLEIIKSKLKLK